MVPYRTVPHYLEGLPRPISLARRAGTTYHRCFLPPSDCVRLGVPEFLSGVRVLLPPSHSGPIDTSLELLHGGGDSSIPNLTPLAREWTRAGASQVPTYT